MAKMLEFQTTQRKYSGSNGPKWLLKTCQDLSTTSAVPCGMNLWLHLASARQMMQYTDFEGIKCLWTLEIRQIWTVNPVQLAEPGVRTGHTTLNKASAGSAKLGGSSYEVQMPLFGLWRH